MKKLWILMIFPVIMACGKDNPTDSAGGDTPEVTKHRLVIENRSDRRCIRLTLYGAEDYVRCNQATSYLGEFEERSWRYIAWIEMSDFEGAYHKVAEGSVFFDQDMNCRIYNDRVRWN